MILFCKNCNLIVYEMLLLDQGKLGTLKNQWKSPIKGLESFKIYPFLDTLRNIDHQKLGTLKNCRNHRQCLIL